MEEFNNKSEMKKNVQLKRLNSNFVSLNNDDAEDILLDDAFEELNQRKQFLDS